MRGTMWTIAAVLAVLWVVGFAMSFGGAWIHLLLLGAVLASGYALYLGSGSGRRMSPQG